MRVFLDTNVLVSAFATRGLSADLFRLILAEHQLLVGEVVLGELRRVLDRKIGLPHATIREIDEFLREYEVIPKPRKPATTPLKDRADRWVLASAMSGDADVFVTGDRELLELEDPPLRIVDPRGFWNLIRGGKPR